ncbi:MAG: hypothetical protein ABIT04_10460 [Novosphingobium sp.]
MATAEARGSIPGQDPGRRWSLPRILMVLLALAAALTAWLWQPLKARAIMAAAYEARLACSCRYVAGQSPALCRADVERGHRLVALSEDEGARSVTARVPPFATQTARWRGESGCQLDPWNNQAAASVVSIQPPPTIRSPA